MADSKDNIESSATDDDFGNDLDEMLKDAESAIDDQDEQDDLIDDEDAIDRLLMDDADYAETQENTDAVNESSEDEVDEFAGDEIDEFAEEVGDEFDVDELINSVTEDESKTEEDESSEQGSTESVMSKIDTENIEDENVEQASEDDLEDDFLMADFDISSDDELIDEEQAGIDEVDEVEEEADSLLDVSYAEEEKAIEMPVSAPVVVPQVVDNSAIEALKVQVAQLLSENESFKVKLADLVTLTSQNDANVEEIETLQKDQRKLKKAIQESESKVPVITYIALGIAIFALLIGGGLGAVGYGAESSVTELTELVMTLEEEIEALVEKDSSADIKKLQDKAEQLVKKDQQINKQLETMSSRLQTNPLKPVVDDLVVQNNHAQEAIETLLAKVETLEKRKPVEVAKSKPKKPKKIVPKVTWVVNLVSFKQEWYAKRKSAEFQKKGIPSEVIQVKVKGENWFRLTVKGFKSKYEAASYAVKVKKSLNLSAVWVTKL